MNPVLWITTFAVLSAAALGLALVSSFWVPMLVGAVALVLLARLLR